MLVNSTLRQIESKIFEACPQYRDKITVSDGELPPDYYVDGRDLLLNFASLVGDAP